MIIQQGESKGWESTQSDFSITKDQDRSKVKKKKVYL